MNDVFFSHDGLCELGGLPWLNSWLAACPLAAAATRTTV